LVNKRPHQALPELLSARVETEIEALQVSQPKVAAEAGNDAGSIRAEADSTAVGVSIGPSVYNVFDEAGPSSSRPFVSLGTDQVRPTTVFTYDSIGFFRPAREYEYDEASLEERLDGLIMDAIQALTSANYLGQSTTGCIPSEDMIAALVRLQTMVSLFWSLSLFFILTFNLFLASQQLVDTLALFDQHKSFHRDQVPIIAGLQHRIFEFELELARRQSLESEVARLNKLLAERESELARHDELVADAELRRNAAKETSWGLSAQLDARTREMFALKAHTDNVEARYSATSCSNTTQRADLSATTAQRKVAEQAQRSAEEAEKAAEEKLKEVESGSQIARADLEKAKSKCHEHRKKSKHYKSKATCYKARADRFHSQALAFTKVRDQTWVNGFRWGFDSLKEFVLNPSAPFPDFAELNCTDFMDIPEEAILELREIRRDLIPDVPDWVGDNADPVGEVIEPANLEASTEAVDIEASAAQVSGEPYRGTLAFFFFFFLVSPF
jgi:hypothetical protein